MKKSTFIIISVFIISLIFSYNLYLDISNFPLEKVLSKKELDFFHIKKVFSENDLIIIKFYDSVPSCSVLERFSLITKIFGENVFFPPNTAQEIYRTTTKIAIKFYLPVVAKYSCRLLLCDRLDNRTYSIQSIKPHVLKSYKIDLTVNSLDDEYLNYSRLLCHGSEWRNRWCEGRNIGIYFKRFFFKSPAIFHFPKHFIIPGARGDPFDKTGDRLDFEPYVVNSFPDNLKVKTNLAYIYGTFWNYHMIWHVMFDFIIPLRKFINQLNGTDSPNTRDIYIRSDNMWIFRDIIKSVSKNGLYELGGRRYYEYLLKKCIIGINKSESGLLKKRNDGDSITFQYNFKREDDPNLRNDILKALDVDNETYGTENNKKLVILVDRCSDMRNINNIMELAESMEKSCPFCDVRVTKYHEMSARDQIKLTSAASVLVGVHGCGLTHALWMHESTSNFTTHLVEILPYMYNCRDWYHTAADFAGVQYHPFMNPKKSVVDPNVAQKYELCIKKNGKFCSSIFCHDILRDGNLIIDIEAFQKVWLPIVKSIKNN